MTTTDLAAGRRAVARKQPANTKPRSRDRNPRVIDGQWRAVRGGPTGTGMFGVIVFLFLAAGITGLILSL